MNHPFVENKSERRVKLIEADEYFTEPRDAAIYFETDQWLRTQRVSYRTTRRQTQESRRNIMRIPSVLGRDVLNKYKLVYDREHATVVITDET